MAELQNYYELLGVATNASTSEINSAYRRRSAPAHPDRPGGDADLFTRLTEAKDVRGRMTHPLVYTTITKIHPDYTPKLIKSRKTYKTKAMALLRTYTM